MTDFVIHPGLLLIVGALLLPLLREAPRRFAIVALPLLVLALVWQVPDGAVWQTRFLDYTITPLQGSKLSRLFATIFSLMAVAGGLYALGQKSRLEVPAAFVYAGSAISVALAGDLITVFIFWEMMAVGSTLVLWSQGSANAYSAARRYLMIHLLGGVILFAGITGHIVQTGSVAFEPMQPDSIAHWLILIGFLINAGAPPLSAWLPDAYPQASWSGTVFLSAFTTKTAVYVLIRGFPGTELLVWIGLFMIFYGVIYALLENDIRRVLVYSIVSHVGFMIVGVGIGTEMAINGAAAHAFSHILYKGLLLMATGSVILMTGRRNCTELGGLFRSMPMTAVFTVIGAMSLSAFPFTAGFASKALISQAAGDSHLLYVWLLLMAAAAAAPLYAGVKLPWFIFFHRDSGLRPQEPPANMRWAMTIFAFLCLALGIWPQALYALLPYSMDYELNTAAHIVSQLQLLLFAALAFIVMRPWLKNMLASTLDADWAWRRLLPALSQVVAVGMNRTGLVLRRASLHASDHLLQIIQRHLGEDAKLARTWSTRGMSLWVLVLLLGYLLLYYFR
ncbi:MAG: Na(+)/H(+) antiporter subunit D [Hylemonella sp.]|nr:Na(+)/H(+) antiporter subunit D [Hylemonella sp.]MDH5708837.1 Na(+)/H(+) antiporter subunit D [Hylemonella sp.]